MENNFALPADYDYDKEERELIAYGAEKLVFLEHVSELFKEVLFTDDNLEKIMQMIVRDRTDIAVLSLYTFTIKRDGIPPKMLAQLTKEYKMAIKNKDVKYVAALVGYDQSYIGHYNMIIWDLKAEKATIFDSLSPSREYFSLSRKIVGGVTRLFSTQFIEISEKFSLQFTGGNSANLPYFLLPHVKHTFDDQLRRISMQAPESQNHFCYLWSIWYFHMFVQNINLESTLHFIHSTRTDPLAVIKAYGYYVLYFMREKVRYKSFAFSDKIRHHFPKYWDRVDPSVFDDNPPFVVREIKLVDPAYLQTFEDCFKYSIEQ